MTLRDYQVATVNKVRAALSEGQGAAPLVCLPTGAGKSHIIAELANTSGRTLVLAHRSELLEQNADKLLRLDPETHISFCCAKLGQRSQAGKVVFASPGSIINQLQSPEHYDLILIDEAHRINNRAIGMFRAIISHYNAPVVGLSATPFRLTGKINESLLKNSDSCERVFNQFINEISIKRLIKQEFLCPIVSTAAPVSVDTANIPKNSFGDFDLKIAEVEYNKKVRETCEDMLSRIGERKKIIIFCCGVEHAEQTGDLLRLAGRRVAIITGHSSNEERRRSIRDFRAGEINFLVGVNIFTEGFDVPCVDCVVLLRPTYSASLYIQMVGRGLRVSPGKDNCLILDYGSNIERHGPIDFIEVSEKLIKSNPFKLCPICDTAIKKFLKNCSNCGFEFPVETRPERAIVSKELQDTPSSSSLFKTGAQTVRHTVEKIVLNVHEKRDFDITKGSENYTLKCDYYSSAGHITTQYLCFNHSGYPRRLAAEWWRMTANEDLPASCEEALSRISEIKGVSEIDVTKQGKSLDKVSIARLGECEVLELGTGLHSKAVQKKEVFKELSTPDDNSTPQLLQKYFPGSVSGYMSTLDE